MHTKDFLAQELRKVGLTEMAAKAETGYYHDFLSPLDFPEMQLLNDLAAMAAKAENGGFSSADIFALRRRHMNGEFDASLEESDEWARSKDGQETMRKLIPGRNEQ